MNQGNTTKEKCGTECTVKKLDTIENIKNDSDIEIVIEERRHRPYSGSNLNEYILLTKKFCLIAPLFLSGFCCTNYMYNDYQLTPENISLQLGVSLAIISIDRFLQWPFVTFLLWVVISLAVNNPIVYYVFHQWILYGIVWIIAIKLCDFEDGQRLFPGFALLHTPSIYINILFSNYENRFFLLVPYFVILTYTLVFHQKWKHEYTYSLNVSKKSQSWWLGVMGVLCVSHWVCFSQLTSLNIIDKNELFDIYKYLDIEYIKFKGICTFVIMFITNSQVFSSVSWRTLSLFLGALLMVLKAIDFIFTFDRNYNFIDTISFGVSFYLFEPINALVYTAINRTNWWNIVPVNIGIKIPVLYFFKYVPNTYTMLVFVPFWIIYTGMILFINEEFKDLDI